MYSAVQKLGNLFIAAAAARDAAQSAAKSTSLRADFRQWRRGTLSWVATRQALRELQDVLKALVQKPVADCRM